MANKMDVVHPAKSRALLPLIEPDSESISQAESVSLYVLFPLLLAFLFGWNHVLFAENLPRILAIALFSALFLMLWWATALITHGVYHCLRRWQPPLWLTTGLGVSIAAVSVLPVVRLYLVWAYNLTSDTPGLGSLQPIAFNMTYFRKFFAGVVPGGVCWILINYFYRNVLHLPRYGTQAVSYGVKSQNDATSPTPLERDPAFMVLLPANQRGPLIALKAEDHYLHVYTENGDGLVRFRFTDALVSVRTLDGLRVHRSYWVKRDAIKSLDKQAHAYDLTLKGDLTVPVSRSYLKDVKAVLG